MSRTTTPSLLDNPTNVALLRDLYAHAAAVGARHGTFGWSGLGGRVADWEHVWTTGVESVTVDDGYMTYKKRTATVRVKVDSVAEVVELLVALRVLPAERFARGGESR